MNCVQCNEPAFVRRRKHRQNLCGTQYCVDLHRWGGGNCDFFPVSSKRRAWVPMDWVVAIGAAVVLVVGVAVVVVHL